MSHNFQGRELRSEVAACPTHIGSIAFSDFVGGSRELFQMIMDARRILGDAISRDKYDADMMAYEDLPIRKCIHT